MDIRTFAAKDTGRLHLRDAKGNLMYANGDETKPMAVTLYGPGSKEHALATAARDGKMLERMRQKDRAPLTADERAQVGAEYLAAVTAGFENIEYGELAGIEMARAVYADRTLGFIADQASEFIGSWANFSQGSAQS